ncbi:MAG: 30S ribosomal protein S20 [Bacteroidales bacterium]
MAHHKSALKRIRQSRKRRLYNRLNKKLVKNAIRSVLESKTAEEAISNFSKANSVLDKVAARGVLHRNNVANKKSRLAKFVNKLKFANKAE